MIDFDRYLRLHRAGTLKSYDDTAMGGVQLLAITGAALEEWGRLLEVLTILWPYIRHGPLCEVGGPCTCELDEKLRQAGYPPLE